MSQMMTKRQNNVPCTICFCLLLFLFFSNLVYLGKSFFVFSRWKLGFFFFALLDHFFFYHNKETYFQQHFLGTPFTQKQNQSMRRIQVRKSQTSIQPDITWMQTHNTRYTCNVPRKSIHPLGRFTLFIAFANQF